MTRATFLHQRLPCVGLFLAATSGVVVGRTLILPGVAYALAAVGLLLLAILHRRAGILLAAGAALAFAAAQSWQFRESAAAELAARLSFAPIPVQATFTVLDAPVSSLSNPENVRFIARLDSVTLPNGPFHLRCPILVRWQGSPPAYGDRLVVRGALANAPPVRNPGAFDYTEWLANAGIRSELVVRQTSEARLVGSEVNPLVAFSISARRWIEQTLAIDIGGTPESALIRAMTIGDTRETTDAMKDAFRTTGTFHLFSVSGLHVAIVAALIWTFLGFFGISQRRSVLIVIPALFFYALLTGLSAASVRAAVMLSILAGGLLLDRPSTPLNSIGAAGLLILAVDSSQLFNPGFQLSFGAVTAIILLAMPIQRHLDKRFAPDPFLPEALLSPLHRTGFHFATACSALLAVSAAAWIATLPLNIAYFHFISFTALPANLIAVPLSTLVLGLASVSLLAGVFSPWLAGIFNSANYALAKFLLFVVQSLAGLPGSSLYVGPPLPAGSQATVVALDASPGAAVAIQTPASTWLVDTGNDFFAETVTLPFLRSRGVNYLNGLVLTHGDGRHIGGANRILSTFHPQVVLDSGLPDRSPNRRRLLATLATQGNSPQPALSELRLPVSPTGELEVLYPPPGAEGVYSDDKAIVLRLRLDRFTALLMSDAGATTEQWLLAHARNKLSADVVIMGHHVSSPSGDPDFLRAIQPRLVVTSGAFFPETERVDPSWLRRLRELGIEVLRQDETGAVTLVIFPDHFTATPFLNPSAARHYSLP